MFSYFKKSKIQKDLFFQIKSELSKVEDENKIAGIYAIFNNDVCLYVGQSKNIASRLATHLSGKYRECDKILIYRSIEEQNFDLIPSEKYVINHFKPIENLLVNYSEEIPIDKIAESGLLYAIENPNTDEVNLLQGFDYLIINDKFNIFLADEEVKSDLYSNENLFYFFMESILSVRESRKACNV